MTDHTKPNTRLARDSEPTTREMAEHIGRRLTRRRHDLGLSLQQLATAAGVSFQRIHEYECGAAAISTTRLRALTSVLGVSPAYFYRGWLLPDRITQGTS